MPSASSGSAAANASCSSDPVAMRISSGVSVAGGVAQHVPAAAHALARLLGRARPASGSFWRVSASATGPSPPLHGQRPGRGRLVGIARPHEPQVRDRAQRRVVLDRLVGRPVLAEADRVVGPDVDDVQPGQRRQPHRPAHVVAERQERGVVRDESAVVGDAVGDPAHGVLADAEAQVAPGLVGAEVRPRP